MPAFYVYHNRYAIYELMKMIGFDESFVGIELAAVEK